MKPYSVLFVCMGNICRSPTAHGVFEHKVKALGLDHAITVDSAGTHNYHPNSPPDQRSQEHAAKRGYDLSQQRARQITANDFDAFDLILVMDYANLKNVQSKCPPHQLSKVQRLTEYCQTFDDKEVPDPYYGGAKGFDHVLDLVEDACDGVVKHVRQQVMA